jgi:hypothetical protein
MADYSCGNSSSGHCYAIAETDSIPNLGVIGDIAINNMTGPNASGFIDNEIWDVSAASGWLEAGEIRADFAAQRYFWAEKYSNGNFIMHYMGNIPSGDFYNYTYFSIYSNCSYACGSWSIVESGNSSYSSATSPDNISLGGVQMGSELAGSSGGAEAADTTFTYRWYQNTSGNWVNIGYSYSLHTSSGAPQTITQDNLPSGGDFYTYCAC